MKRVGIIANHCASASPKQTRFDLIIRNGTLIDGLRTPRFVTDIGVVGSNITTVGRIAKDASCAREIDATGKIVCPGFVDLHTHYDAQLFWDPYCTLSGWHGVTSVVIGNCGFSYAPVMPELRERTMKTMERTEAVPYESQEKGMPWDWVTFPEFLDSVDRTPLGVNICAYQGLAPLMIHVMGLENAKKRAATKEEMTEMKALLREAMEAGACGFSAQITGEKSVQRDFDGTPMVTDTMANEDVYEFCTVLSDLGRGFIQCTGPGVKMTENMAKASGRPIIWNAVAPQIDDLAGKGVLDYLLKWIKEANAEKGLRIYAQGFTTTWEDGSRVRFTLDIWNLFDGSPPWRKVLLGSAEERMEKMRDPQLRAACKAQYDSDWMQGVLTGDDAKAGQEKKSEDGGLGRSLVDLTYLVANQEKNKRWEGMTLQQIATERNQHVVDAFFDVSIDDGLKNTWETKPRISELPVLKRIAADPFVLPGLSDGGAHTKFAVSADYTTDFLTQLVREYKTMDLEEAHWRLAKYPAQAAGLLDRGALGVGMPADLVIYDLKNLKVLPEEIIYDFPGGEWRRSRRAEGYDYTIVNGVVTFEGLRCTGATPGKLLRHGRAS